MTISNRLDSYLTAQNISLHAIEHDHSASSFDTTIKTKILVNQITKFVILKDHEDRKLIAVLPAKKNELICN